MDSKISTTGIMGVDGIFDRRIVHFQDIAERVNSYDAFMLDRRIRKLEEIYTERELTFEELMELQFISLKILSYDRDNFQPGF